MQVKDLDLLLALITGKKVSRRKLSEYAGWRSHTYLQRILRGEITTLTTDRAYKIAHYLGVPVEVLFLPRVSSDAAQFEQESSPSKGTAA